MIIEKTYNFDDIPKEYYNTPIRLRDYHRTILANIIRQGNNFILKGYNDHVIVTGVEGYVMLEDQAGFFINSISSMNFVNDYIEKIGMLNSKDVYYDRRLETNKIIFGSDLRSVEYYIRTKGRKEKLIKINASKTSTIS